MAKDMLDFNVEHSKEIDASKKLKVGIIGTGWIVESAVRSVQNTETFTARLWVSENALTYSAVCSDARCRDCGRSGFG